jgi:hypothetical protein
VVAKIEIVSAQGISRAAPKIFLAIQVGGLVPFSRR